MSFRQQVIKLVMLTDLSKHFEFIAELDRSPEGSALAGKQHGGGLPDLTCNMLVRYACAIRLCHAMSGGMWHVACAYATLLL